MTTTAIHVGAVPITEVTCPSWCTVTQAEHLENLPNCEGRALHWSAETRGDGWGVRIASSTFADGQLDMTDPPSVFAHGPRENTSPDEALRFAVAILEAAIAAKWELEA